MSSLFRELFALQLFLILILAPLTKSVRNASNSEIYVSEDVGNGKRYFIQYRKLSEPDTYVNIRKKIFNDLEGEHDKSEEDDEGQIGFLRAKPKWPVKKPTTVIDDEWNAEMGKTDLETPEVAQELYKLMRNDDVYNINNATVIKCLFQSSTDNESNVFRFDLSSLENLEDLVILDAELHLYRYPDEASETVRAKADNLVRLFQILPLNDTEDDYLNETVTDSHRLLSVVYISSTYKGWQTFKVKTALDSWMEEGENLGFLITAVDGRDNPVELAYANSDTDLGQFRPILTVYLRNPQDPSTEPSRDFAEPKITVKKVKPLTYFGSSILKGQVPCSRHIWYVNFDEVGWGNAIVSPKGYMAYICKGSCESSSLTDYSNHAKMLNMYGKVNGQADGPRCVPTTFKPLVVMFYDKYENIVIKKYSNMIVEKCGCR